MANIFKSLLNSLKLQDDEDDDDDFEFDDEQDEEPVRERLVKHDKPAPQPKQPSAPQSDRWSSSVRPKTMEAEKPSTASASSQSGFFSQKAHYSSNYNTSTYIENRGNGKAVRVERSEGSKVIPIRTTNKGLEVCIIKPKEFEESLDICDVLLSGKATVINFAGFPDKMLAQRMMDIIVGAVYAMNGKLSSINDDVFIACPESVDISGLESDFNEQGDFEIPTLQTAQF